MLRIENGSMVRKCAAVALLMLVAASVYAGDEEVSCKFFLRQVGLAWNRESAANQDVKEKADYLQRIALMSQRALQSVYPSSAGQFSNEMARASDRLDTSRAHRDSMESEFRTAFSTFVQQCPKHYAATNGNTAAIVQLVENAMGDSGQPGHLAGEP